MNRFIAIIFMHTIYATTYANTVPNVCLDTINIANRPSIIDSPCSVPFKRVMMELNYQAQQLNDNGGSQQNFPNAMIRVGLPANHEFFTVLPNYIQQTSAPKSGSTTAIAGIKHSFQYNKDWLFAVEEVVNLPSGSAAYGSQGWGGEFNGIANYAINEQLNITAMLGIARISDAQLNGGRAFNSINPDIVLSYSPIDTIAIYGEIYGQSKIGPTDGAGFNLDAGFVFQISKNTLFNISAGQQLYNYLGGFTHYVNAGVSLLL